jgi:hypothetical protein
VKTESPRQKRKRLPPPLKNAQTVLAKEKKKEFASTFLRSPPHHDDVSMGGEARMAVSLKSGSKLLLLLFVCGTRFFKGGGSLFLL